MSSYTTLYRYEYLAKRQPLCFVVFETRVYDDGSKHVVGEVGSYRTAQLAHERVEELYRLEDEGC